ncbi:phosphatidylinositol phosphatase PTPRQ-like [Amblyomma americanum]
MNTAVVFILCLTSCSVGGHPDDIDCRDTAATLINRICYYGQTCTVTCPACIDAEEGRVYGTAQYASQSSVCKSAIHDQRVSGAAPFREIVSLLVYEEDGYMDFTGSTRFRITSERWSDRTDYFVFASPRRTEHLLDITALHRNFIYGKNTASALECHSPESPVDRADYTIKEVPFRRALSILTGSTEGVFPVNIPSNSYPHSRTNLFWCMVHSSLLSDVASPALYNDHEDGPTFLPIKFTVTASLGEPVTLQVQAVPGSAETPRVMSWVRVTAGGRADEVLSDGGCRMTWTIPRADVKHNGVYIANGPRVTSPGKNRAVFRVIVRSCRHGMYGIDCNNQCPDCKNGGVCHDTSGECICPPGFKGHLCETPCGDDFFGRQCSRKCSDTNLDKSVKSCKGILVCLTDPYGCSCGTGFHGPFCTETCPPHRYGADCAQSRVCFCKTANSCDIHTGTCTQDNGACRQGWGTAPYCDIKVDKSSPVLRSRPFVSSVTEDAATVIFRRWDSKNDIGVGTPREYRIQYRVVPGTTWQSKTVSATSSEMYAVLVNGLMVGAEYEVRILVVTEDGLYTEQDAKATRFQTQCGVPKIPPENVSFDNHSASEIVVKWQNPAREHWSCWSASVVLDVNETSVEFNLTSIETNPVEMYRIPVVPHTLTDIRMCIKTPCGKQSVWTRKWSVMSAEDAPTVIQKVRLEKTTAHDVQLSWSLPQESNGIIRHYRVVYTPIAPSCPRLEQGETQITVPSSTRSTTITGLHPSTRYLVSVAAVTIAAGPAYNMTAQTLPDDPQGRPINLQHSAPLPGTDLLTWSEMPCDQINARTYYYHLEFASRDPWEKTSHEWNTSYPFHVCGNLLPFTAYEARVFAGNEAGRSPLFAAVNFTTAASAPAEPEGLVASHVTQTTARLSWEAPYPPRGILDHYQLKISSGDSLSETVERNVDHEDCKVAGYAVGRHCYTIKDLQPATTYSFSVRAMNKGTAYSPYSSELEITTEQLEGPEKIECSDRQQHSLRIRWHMLDRANGMSTTFVVNVSQVNATNSNLVPFTKPKVFLINDTALREYTLTELSAGLAYSVCVQTKTGHHLSRPTCANFTTLPSMIPAQTDLLITSSARTAVATWRQPKGADQWIDHYHVLYWPVKHMLPSCSLADSLEKEVIVPPRFCNASLEGLVPHTVYGLTITAITAGDIGLLDPGSLQQNLTFSTKEEAPNGRPRNLRHSKSVPGLDALEWSEIPCKEANGDRISYYLELESLDIWGTKHSEWNTSYTYQMCDGLVPFTMYMVRLYAQNDVGRSPLFTTINFTTAASAPPQPTDMVVSQFNQTTVLVSWKKPYPPNGILDQYQLRFWSESDLWRVTQSNFVHEECRNQKAEIPKHCCFVGGLDPSTTYYFSVRAMNKGTPYSSYSPELQFRTSELEPPNNLSVSERTETSLTIHWQDSSMKNQGPARYAVNCSEIIEDNSLETESSKTSATIKSFMRFQHTITGLSPGRTYFVCVQALSDRHFSEANCANFSTKPSVVPALRDLKIAATAHEVIISWSRPEDAYQWISHYHVAYWPVAHMNPHCALAERHQRELIVSSNSCNATLQELRPYTLYSVIVRAATTEDIGLLDPEQLQQNASFSTEAAAPHGRPSNLRHSTSLPGMDVLKWSDVPCADVNGPTHSFYLMLQSLDPWEKEPRVWNTSETFVMCPDLAHFATYRATLYVQNNKGRSPLFATIDFRTAASAPTEITELLVSQDNQSTVRLSWKEPYPPNGILDQYQLRFWSEDDPSKVTETSVPYYVCGGKRPQNLRHCCSLDNVAPSTNYYFSVRAMNMGTPYSPYTAKIQFTTADLEPPENLSLSLCTETTLQIHWQEAPMKTAGPTSYVVNCTEVNAFNNQEIVSALQSFVINDCTLHTHSITGLSPGKTYTVCVQAVRGSHFSEGNCRNFTTKPSVIPALSGLTASARAHEAFISWSQPEGSSQWIRHYHILYWPVAHKQPQCLLRESLQKELIVTANSCNATLEDLQPYTLYAVTVSAVTTEDLGFLDPERLQQNTSFSTKAAAPHGRPSKFRHSTSLPGFDVLEWSHIPCENVNAANHSYCIELENLDARETEPRVWNTSDSSLACPDLAHFTAYRATLYVQNDIGRSPLFATMNFKTAASAPPEPTGFLVSYFNQTSARLSWHKPYPPNGVLDHYQVRFWTEHDPSTVTEMIVAHEDCENHRKETPRHCCMLYGLDPSTIYHVSVRAMNQGTPFSSYSGEVHFETAEMEAPRNLSFSNRTENSIQIHWVHPFEKYNRPVTYKVNCSDFDAGNGSLASALTQQKTFAVKNCTLQSTLTALSPGSTYFVCVQAITGLYFSEATCTNFSTKPSAVPALSDVVIDARSNAADISWSKPTEADRWIRQYRLVYRPVVHIRPRCRVTETYQREINVQPDSGKATLEELRPYTLYAITITAIPRPDRGYLDPGRLQINASFSTTIAPPEGRPTNLTHAASLSGMDVVTWSEFPCSQVNAATLSYHLLLESRDPWETSRTERDTSQPFYLFENLAPFTKYEVKLYAQNDAGRSRKFAAMNFTTAPSAPPAPKYLLASEVTETTILLSWKAPYPPRGVLDHYQLKISADEQLSQSTERVIAFEACDSSGNATDRHCYTARDLDPSTTYNVQVRAMNRGTSYSPYSSVLKVTTGDLEPVESVYCSERTRNSLTVHWRLHGARNCMPTEFWVKWSAANATNDSLALMSLQQSYLVSDTTIREHILSDLFPGTTYLVCIHAKKGTRLSAANCATFTTNFTGKHQRLVLEQLLVLLLFKRQTF